MNKEREKTEHKNRECDQPPWGPMTGKQYGCWFHCGCNFRVNLFSGIFHKGSHDGYECCPYYSSKDAEIGSGATAASSRNISDDKDGGGCREGVAITKWAEDNRWRRVIVVIVYS